MATKKLFVIGHTFPEPTTTAAGNRMMQLLRLFISEGYAITFGSTASPSDHSAPLKELGISCVALQLNDGSFDELIQSLQPNVVLFDRFITEEQFGWRLDEQCPEALKILDTEDLHFLRKARQEAIKQGKRTSNVDVYTEAAKRELASILRCDLTLIISEVEMELLEVTFSVPKGLIYYLPLFAEPPSEVKHDQLPTFENRNHFISIGNFKHAPNLDAVLQLKQHIWPEIRSQLPHAELHVYGHYAPQQITQLHDEAQGFLIKGWAESAEEVMQYARVSLAPLRFGAGLKGKVIDAMRLGTPTVTTNIGAEGINGDHVFAGAITHNIDDFIAAAVQLYTNRTAWCQASKQGLEIIQNRFDSSLFSEAFMRHVQETSAALKNHRKRFFISQILQQQTTQASKYLSKWIEEKNK